MAVGVADVTILEMLLCMDDKICDVVGTGEIMRDVAETPESIDDSETLADDIWEPLSTAVLDNSKLFVLELLLEWPAVLVVERDDDSVLTDNAIWELNLCELNVWVEVDGLSGDIVLVTPNVPEVECCVERLVSAIELVSLLVERRLAELEMLTEVTPEGDSFADDDKRPLDR